MFDNICDFYDSITIINENNVVSLCSNSLILMKFIFILLFFSTVVTNELVLDIIVLQDNNTSLCENPGENQSEKENQDSSETEADYFNSTSNIFYSIKNNVNLPLRHYSFYSLISYLEIHIPPPEYRK
jgi:hypothetical protein